MKTKNFIKFVLFGCFFVILFSSLGFAQNITNETNSTSPPSSDHWVPKAGMPTARDDLAVVAFNGKIYAIGGTDSSGCLSTVEVYDPLTNAWATDTPMPTKKCTVGAVVIGDKIYVVGDGNITYSYDPATGMWTTKAEIPVGFSLARYQFAVGAVDGKMYVSGGNAKDWMYSYDPPTNIWTPKTPVPVTRSIESFAAMDGKLYAIGGGEPKPPPTEITRIDVYDPSTDTWAIGGIRDMPTRRTHLGPTTPVVNGKMYVIGGWNGYTALSRVEAYDLLTDSWSVESSMPTARYELAHDVAGGKIYAIGGNWGPAGGHWLSVNEEFTPPLPALYCGDGICSPEIGETFENCPQDCPPLLPDLIITDVRPVQVVFDVDINKDNRIDLVKEKNTSIIIPIEMINPKSIEDTEDIDILASINGKVVVFETFNAGNLKQTNEARLFFVPDFDGDAEIAVTIDPLNLIEETDETNNDAFKDITVKDTKSLRIVYIPITQLSQYPEWDIGELNFAKYYATAGNSSKFIKTTYPISEQEFSGLEVAEPYDPPPQHIWWPPQDYCREIHPSFKPVSGLVYDADQLYKLGKRYDHHVDRVVAIVPVQYLIYHDEPLGTVGVSLRERKCDIFKRLTIKWKPTVFALQDWWTPAAHEIGHTYSLPTAETASIFDDICEQRIPREEYNEVDGYPANGFWVKGEEYIKDSICFMGKALYSHFPQIKNNYFGAWIDDHCYEHLFEQFKVSSTDPEQLLLMDGLVFKNGTIAIGDWYLLENGTTTDIMPGDYSIEFLDLYGSIISEVKFDLPFQIDIENLGLIETDFSSFAFAIPYPVNATKIRIQNKTVAMAEVDISAKLLDDVVSNIPEFGFIKNPEQRRKALQNKIIEVEEKINSGEIRDAINKLKHDVRDKLEKWLVEDYEVVTPLQVSKQEALDLIDRIISGLKDYQ